MKKYVLLNNLGSKHSLLMKFDQFMSYYKRKNFIKKLHENCGPKASSTPFCVCKELSTTSIGEATFIRYLLIKICPNQHTDFLRFLFTEDSLKIKKGLEVVFTPHFSEYFLIQNFIL